jgi:PTS system nitrogen regulatory IIA component
MGFGKTEEGLAELIERGGIYRDVRGNTPREILTALIESLPPIPAVPADKLLEAVLEREALMSTCIGKGIALPHPRNPLVTESGGQFVALAFLEHPVDWNSLDGQPADTLLLIVSASARRHLQTLSKINFFCRQEDFYWLLKKQVSKEKLFEFIREAEANWK